MPSITIWPPPRLTRPTRDSPFVTSVALVSILAVSVVPDVVVPVVWVLVVWVLAVVVVVVFFFAPGLGTRVTELDDVSSVSPSAGGAADAVCSDASERVGCRAEEPPFVGKDAGGT